MDEHEQAGLVEAEAVEWMLWCAELWFLLFSSRANILSYSHIRSFLPAPKKYKDAIMTTHLEYRKNYFCFLGDSALSELLKEMRLLGSQCKPPAGSWMLSTCGRWWGHTKKPPALLTPESQ